MGVSPRTPEFGVAAVTTGSTRTAILVGLAAAALHVALRPDILATLGTLYDDIVYLTLGKALAEGHGYRSIHLVGAPVHVKFPPLLPLSYAAFWSLTGTLKGAVYGAYSLSMLHLAGGVAALWLYGRAMGIRWWLLAILAVGPLLLLRTVRYFAGAVSEPWFLFGWAASLLLVDRLGSKKSHGFPRREALLMGLVLGASVLARTQAVVLIPAILVAMLLRRIQGHLIAITAAGAVVPIAIWKWMHGRMMAAGPVSMSLDQSSYMEWMIGESFAETLTSLSIAAKVNLPAYLQHASNLLVGWASWKGQTLVIVGATLALIGMALTVRKRPELTLSILAVVTVLLFWPFNQTRFLTTLLPIGGVAAAYALDRGYGLLPPRVRQGVIVGSALFVFALGMVNMGIRRTTYAYQASEGSLPVGIAAASDWIESNTAADDYILADYSGVYFLRTGRMTSIGLPEQPFTLPSVLIPEGRYLAQRLLADSVDYVIDARPSEARIGPQIEAVRQRCPDVLHPLDPLPRGELSPTYYSVTRDEACLVPLANQ